MPPLEIEAGTHFLKLQHGSVDLEKFAVYSQHGSLEENCRDNSEKNLSFKAVFGMYKEEII